jgi:aminopeptidase N
MSFLAFDAEQNQRQPFELPGARPHYNPDRPGQVEHIALELSLDLAHCSFEGVCRITLRPLRPELRTLTLDAAGLTIERVQIQAISQPFEQDGEKLRINLLAPLGPAPVTLDIAYRVERPQRGLYFIGPDEHYPDKPVQVWTQGEDEDSRFWFPCFDYPGQLATSEIRVEIAKPYQVVSNGALQSQEDRGETQIFHWRQDQPHPTYLMTLAAGDFACLTDAWRQIPITYWVEKGQEDSARLSLGKTPRMVDFFSAVFGYDYPFAQYAQVCVADFIFGGMENTATTLLTDRCLLDERAALDNRNTESLVAHELAHQWFGDLVVIKHWSHAWLKEGMASYAEVLWTEQEYGLDDGAYYLLGEARNYLQEDASRYRRPMVTHVYREAIELYDRHLYEKGACVYHMIRGLLGEEGFQKAIQTFVRDNAHQTVETVDLLRAIDKATGANLLWLFDQYVFRGGHPEFKLAYSWDAEAKLARFTATQTQAEKDPKDLFNLKIPLAFYFGADQPALEFSLHLQEKEQSFYFPLPQAPAMVCFDPCNSFLKTLELDYPPQLLTAQLQGAPSVISRIEAALALGKKGDLAAVTVLETSLSADPFWGVRVEVAEQLGQIKLQQAADALIRSLETNTEPKVRKAILSALGNHKTLEVYTTLFDRLQNGEASYYSEAAASRSLGAVLTGTLSDKIPEALTLFQEVLQTRRGWNEVVRAGAVGGLSHLKTSAEAARLILDYTELGTPQPLRLAAIRALGAVSTGQAPEILTLILDRLEAIAQEEFFLTQVAVCGALGQMETPKALTILQSLKERSLDGRAQRLAEEALGQVRKKIGAEVKLQAIQADLERLREENQDLKSRLAKLESQSTPGTQP